MGRVKDWTQELTEIEKAALFGSDLENIDLNTRTPDAATLLEEIRLLLTKGGDRSIVKARPEDVDRINHNLARFLETSEQRAGRSRVATAYGGDAFTDAATRYSKDKWRFTHEQNRAMEVRFRLVEAGCDALRQVGTEQDTAEACFDLFSETGSRLEIIDMYESDILNDAGRIISNAWQQIAMSMDQEFGLKTWHTQIHGMCASGRRSRIPVEQLMNVDLVVDVSGLGATYGRDIPENGAFTDEYLRDPHIGPAVADGFGKLNLINHVNEFFSAPGVVLFCLPVWSADGSIVSAHSDKAVSRGGLKFWREITLHLLPDTEGQFEPYIVNKLSTTLHEGSSSGHRLPMRYPYTRADEIETLNYAPLFLTKGEVHRFEPDQPWPMEGGINWNPNTLRSCYANVWPARPDIIPIFLRHLVDLEGRPFGAEIRKAAAESPVRDTFFPPASIGAVIERATLIPDRSKGIGGLLRADFLRKAKAIEEATGASVLLPPHQAFDRAWS